MSRRAVQPDGSQAILSVCLETQTWEGNAVLVLGHVVVQSHQHHPHGQREHPGQEGVEHQVEEQDEGWRKLRGREYKRRHNEWKRQRVMYNSLQALTQI